MQKIIRFLENGKISYGLFNKDNATISAIQGSIYNGDWQPTEKTYNLKQIKLLSPCTPTKVIGIGLNYHSVCKQKNTDPPVEPIIFLKPSSSIIGPGEKIIFPKGCQELNYEVELGVVIKSKAKNISREKAFDYVLGYTCANDITAKDFMEKGQPWTKGKAFDTSMPLGPCIFISNNKPVFQLKMYLNDQKTQDESTNDMVFGVDSLIEYITGLITLYPGDVIVTGTPPGKGKLKRGDKITAGIDEIGTLTNFVE